MEIRKGGWFYKVLVWGGLPRWYDGTDTCDIAALLFIALVKTLMIFLLSYCLSVGIGDFIAWVTFCIGNLTFVPPNGPTISLLVGLTTFALLVLFCFDYQRTQLYDFWLSINGKLCLTVKIRGEG